MSDATPGGGAPADPIEHVLVLALENRSFDHMLGACQGVKAEIDGTASIGPQRTNSYGGRTYPQIGGATRILVDRI